MFSDIITQTYDAIVAEQLQSTTAQKPQPSLHCLTNSTSSADSYSPSTPSTPMEFAAASSPQRMQSYMTPQNVLA